mgnify:CR=1 FL=1
MVAIYDAEPQSKTVFEDPAAALHTPIGAASPLWMMFAGAATMGVAYWWLSRWRATNLEAVMGAETLALPAPAVEAAPAALQPAAEPESPPTELTAMESPAGAAIEVTADVPVIDAGSARVRKPRKPMTEPEA